jgi:hypothetical protein
MNWEYGLTKGLMPGMNRIAEVAIRRRLLR